MLGAGLRDQTPPAPKGGKDWLFILSFYSPKHERVSVPASGKPAVHESPARAGRSAEPVSPSKRRTPMAEV